MGGEGSFPIPGVMIPKALGESLKAELKASAVTMEFAPKERIERPELIDTLATFSSQGPRDLDALIKPEITAPGVAIISARIGSGSQAVEMGGTSMAAPHIAGIAALLIQYKKNLSAKQIKSLILNSGILIGDESVQSYPISRQGAGRVRADLAAQMNLVADTPALSLGRFSEASGTSVSKVIHFTNTGDSRMSYGLLVKADPNVAVTLSQNQLSLASGETAKVEVMIDLKVPGQTVVELDAFIQITQGGQVQGVIPMLAVVNHATQIQLTDLNVEAPDAQGSFGALVRATFVNSNVHEGQALMFNALGKDPRKEKSNDPYLSHACDLESVGQRILAREDGEVLQVAVKLYNPLTTWNTCDVEVEFDLDGDKSTDKELVGTIASTLPGLNVLEVPGLASVLIDSKKLGEILSQYNQEVAEQGEESPELNLLPAVDSMRPMVAFGHGTLAIVEVPINRLGNNKDVQVKVSISYNGGDVVERRDVLDGDGEAWKKLSLDAKSSAYTQIPEVVIVPAGGIQTVELVKGHDLIHQMISYFPRNKFILSDQGMDTQSQLADPIFSQKIDQP